MQLFQEHHKNVYHGEVARKLKFDSFPNARKHNSVLKQSLEKGVAFAGHYSAAVWGCGTNCIGFSLIDVASGEVAFYASSLTYHDLDITEEKNGVPLGATFLPDSNLLIVNPSCETNKENIKQLKNLAFGDGRPRKYYWDGKRFHALSLN